MDVVVFGEAVAFAEAARPVIDAHPAHCSILATTLCQVIDGQPMPNAEPVPNAEPMPNGQPTPNGQPMSGALWLLISDDEGRPVAAAMQTPPFNLFITPLPPAHRMTAISLLTHALLSDGREVPGITAGTADGLSFADYWQLRTGRRPELTMSERLYEIDNPPQLPTASGSARLVSDAPDDVQLATSWLKSFSLEAFPERPAIDEEKVIRHRIARGWLLFWEDDGAPVSLAGVHRAAYGTGRIGPVYTPGAARRRGYGAAVTVAATRLSFENGAARCVLYADQANPTANGLYQAIGYRQIGEALMIAFH